MDVRIHDEILWHACELARRRNPNLIDDPRKYYPLMALGTFRLDYRQATIFVDIIKQGLSASEKTSVETLRTSSTMRTLLRQMWEYSCDDHLHRMTTEWGVEKSIVEDAKARVQGAGYFDDLGSYFAADHLDVLDSSEKFAREEEEYFRNKNNKLGRSKTVDGVMGVSLKSRLGNALAPVNGNALAWQPMTEFGEVLHIVADFYAHTNYVELLLWELATRGYMRESYRDAFNEVPNVAPGVPPGFLCPLPDAATVEQRTSEQTLFCYRATPAATPLVSSLFVLEDTAQSLLRRFADHLYILQAQLTKEQCKQDLNEQLDLVMAIFDMSQTTMAKPIIDLLVGAKSELREIGKYVRRFVARQLRSLGDKGDAAQRDKFQLAANLVEGTDLSEATEWAQAGKYSYLAYSIERTLARELNYGSTPISERRFHLPHHSLLRKDKEEHDVLLAAEVPTQLRYRLACLLAVETVAQLIEWRFASSAPDRSAAMAILASKARHPSIQLAEIAAVSDGATRLTKLGDKLADIAAPTWPEFLRSHKRMDQLVEVMP